MKIKLSSHCMDEGQPTSKDYITKLEAATLKVIVDLDSLRNDTMMDLLNTAANKGLLIVGRRYDDDGIDLDAPDMKAEAQRYFNGQRAPSFPALAAAFPMIQVWEGPNEPDVQTPERMQRYAAFSNELAFLMMTEAKRRSGIGAWAVGTPDFPLWQYWQPALAAVLNFKAVLTRHSYGPLDKYFSLRHREDQAHFTAMGFPDMPLLITECGTDTLWNAQTFNKPWRELYGYGDDALARYWVEWGRPFEEALAKDAYVLGAHWFTFGNGGGAHWNTYDLAHLPVADEILRNPPTPTPDPWPAWATHRVTAQVLNVREFPWLGSVTPDIMGTLTQGTYVKSYGADTNWHRIGVDGNRWVSGRYLQARP